MLIREVFSSIIRSSESDFTVRALKSSEGCPQNLVELFHELCVSTCFDVFEMCLSVTDSLSESDASALLRSLNDMALVANLDAFFYQRFLRSPEKHCNLRREAASFWLSQLDSSSHISGQRGEAIAPYLSELQISSRTQQLICDRSLASIALVIRSSSLPTQTLLEWSITRLVSTPSPRIVSGPRERERSEMRGSKAFFDIPSSSQSKAFTIGVTFVRICVVILLGILLGVDSFAIRVAALVYPDTDQLQMGVMCLREEFVDSRFCDGILYNDSYDFQAFRSSPPGDGHCCVARTWAFIFCFFLTRLYGLRPKKKCQQTATVSIKETIGVTASLEAAYSHFIEKWRRLASHGACLALFRIFKEAPCSGIDAIESSPDFKLEETLSEVGNAIWRYTPDARGKVVGSLPCLTSLLLFVLASYRSQHVTLDHLLPLENDLSMSVLPFINSLSEEGNIPVSSHTSLLISIQPHLLRVCRNLQKFSRTPPETP